MHINMNGGGFNPRDSSEKLMRIYRLCATNSCERCRFGNGDWVDAGDGDMIRCDTAFIKQRIKNGKNNEQ